VFKIGILLSGRGSNFLSIYNNLDPNGKIVVVISDKKDAEGLQKARELGIETVHIKHKHEKNIIEALKKHNVDLVVLAGYMKIISSTFCASFPEKIINIHPSLLPSFPGLHAQKQAFEYGVKYSGVTVHYVDEGMDTGKIIAQIVVPRYEKDTLEEFEARILEQEHKLYPRVVNWFINDKQKVI